MIWSDWGKRLVALPGVSAFTTFIGLGTAAFKNTGTSGDTVPKNDTANTFSGTQTISITVDSALPAPFVINREVSTANEGAALILQRGRSGPAAVQNADRLADLGFSGYNGSAYPSTLPAALRVFATETHSGSVAGTRYEFLSTLTGSTTRAARLTIEGSGLVTAPFGLGRGAPVTKTADFTVALGENWLINNKSGSACTVTLPSASAFPGREIMFKNIQAQAVNSASSNVVPLAGGAAGTVIVTNTAGRWVTLVSDGTNWIAMAGVI